MISSRLSSLFLFFLLASSLCVSLVYSAEINFIATLDGRQEVPPVVTLGEGSASISIDDDDTLHYDISYDFLGEVTAIHFHAPARAGNNAETMFVLDDVAIGSTDGEIKGDLDLTETQVDYFKNGLVYLNIHTDEHPDGEIRGQVTTSATNFIADPIDGDSQIPTVVTTATGKATVDLDSDNLKMDVKVSHNVDNVIAIHIHGPATESQIADPIFDFGVDDDDNVEETFTLTLLHLEHLRNGLLYVNIHSQDHPNGEIRGQIYINEDNPEDRSDYIWLYVGLSVAVLALVLVGVILGAAFLVYKKEDSFKKFTTKHTPPSMSSEPLVSDTHLN